MKLSCNKSLTFIGAFSFSAVKFLQLDNFSLHIQATLWNIIYDSRLFMNPGRVIKTMLNFHYFSKFRPKQAKNGKFASLDRLRAKESVKNHWIWNPRLWRVINFDKITCSLINQIWALSPTNLWHKYFKSNVREFQQKIFPCNCWIITCFSRRFKTRILFMINWLLKNISQR